MVIFLDKKSEHFVQNDTYKKDDALTTRASGALLPAQSFSPEEKRISPSFVYFSIAWGKLISLDDGEINFPAPPPFELQATMGKLISPLRRLLSCRRRNQ